MSFSDYKKYHRSKFPVDGGYYGEGPAIQPVVSDAEREDIKHETEQVCKNKPPKQMDEGQTPTTEKIETRDLTAQVNGETKIGPEAMCGGDIQSVI